MKIMSWASPRSKRFWLRFTLYWFAYCACLLIAANLDTKVALVGFSLSAGFGLCLLLAMEDSR